MAQSVGIPPLRSKKSNLPALLGVVFVLLLVVALGIFIFAPKETSIAPPVSVPNTSVSQPPIPVPNTSIINVTVNASCDSACLLSRAIAEKNPDFCTLIQNSSLRSSCINNISLVSLSACRLVDDQSKRDLCLLYFAQNTSDVSLCDSLSASNRSTCRSSVDYCSGSKSPLSCNAIRSSDISLCSDDSNCIIDFAMAKNDLSVCSSIAQIQLSAACTSSVKKSDDCYSLSVSLHRDLCRQIYAQKTNQLVLCREISSGVYASRCLAYFAINQSNVSLCSYSGTVALDDLWSCYINYSLETGDSRGCFNIDALAVNNRFNCAFNTAKLHGDPSACEAISDLGTREVCYQAVLIYNPIILKPSTCAAISQFQWRNKCYNEAAKVYNNVSYCAFADDQPAKDTCVLAYEVNHSKSISR
ncbi:hypothetical protein HY990_04635 [Candidatus Micrarchaeota archaeon]|nr:hypothetical protein [Candidatus Micrarchaeota archaeon]